MQRTVTIHPDAPIKPAPGQACNGCGVCCLAEPCPAGMVVSRRRHGACTALRWDEAQSRYRCGLIDAPEQLIAPRWLARLAAHWVPRWIAAGQGCDCDFVVQPSDSAS